MGIPAVAEAAVVGLAHPRWDERPLALVVPRAGREMECTTEAVRSYLAEQFPKWWLPDAVVLVEAIPKTSVGKFLKSAIRERYRDFYIENSASPFATQSTAATETAVRS